MQKPVLLWRGFRFGMLLQLAVGPVCLLTLSTAGTQGFAAAMAMVAAVTLADAFYVSLSALGVAALVGRPKVKTALRFAGGAVLVLFGLDLGVEALGVTLLPGLSLFSASSGAGPFAQGLVITLSNPLTILFWGGMLTAKVAENRWNRAQLGVFAAGCVLSTAVFLTAVSALGGIFAGRLPAALVTGLNLAVGAALAFFGVRLMLKKQS
jgi:threonine/homoserine/homoserine lactone efflux protein